jgi:hypothetical protein
MRYAYFITTLHAWAAQDNRVDARFEAIRVSKADAACLITRHRLTPYSIDPVGSESFAFVGAPLQKVVVCRGSLEEPQVAKVQVADAVWWIGRGWLRGEAQSGLFARLWGELCTYHRGNGTIEVHPLCRTENVTLDDIVQMSGLS